MAAGWNIQIPMEKYTTNSKKQKLSTSTLYLANQNHSKIPLHIHLDVSKKKRWTRINIFHNVEKLEHLYIAGQMQNGAATVKNGSESAKILSTEFPYDLAIALKR